MSEKAGVMGRSQFREQGRDQKGGPASSGSLGAHPAAVGMDAEGPVILRCALLRICAFAARPGEGVMSEGGVWEEQGREPGDGT